jgi:hypothetical protein
VLVSQELVKDVGFLRLTAFIGIQNFFHVLFAARMVLISCPVRVEFLSDLSIFLFALCLLHEWVLQ